MWEMTRMYLVQPEGTAAIPNECHRRRWQLPPRKREGIPPLLGATDEEGPHKDEARSPVSLPLLIPLPLPLSRPNARSASWNNLANLRVADGRKDGARRSRSHTRLARRLLLLP